jgi:methyl-accepting chemotaxis protein
LLLASKRLLDTYQSKVVPNRKVVDETTMFMMQTARRNNNTALLFSIGQIATQIADMRFANAQYMHTRDDAQAKAIQAKSAEVRSTLEQMKAFIRPPVAEAYSKLAPALTTWLEALSAMIEAGTSANAAIAGVRDIRVALTKDFADLNDGYDKDMNAQGPVIRMAMVDGGRQMLIGSAIGLVIGAFAAFFIILGLIRVLRETGAFARSLAAGDFQAQVSSREKGEIGELLESMRQIPSVLQSILHDYQSLEKRVEVGELEAKGDPGAYKGGFATMIAGTNAILQRFLHILENIPSPVMMMSTEFKATYLNAVGRSVCGADYKGKVGIVAREDAGTPGDALHNAAATLKPATAETHARPQGRGMDISYTALPMLDAEGKLACVLQLVTDLTAIKQTQRTIRNVADQAAAITNRVAAASEELSAQVEQVSRGAEMQRARVDSTATAMTEMNSTVMEVAKNAGEAAGQAETTRSKAADGATLVDRVVQAINTVNTVAGTLQTNMQELGG